MILEVFLSYSSIERKNLRIRVLALHDNDFIDLNQEHFIALCEALLDCTDVEQLSLENNQLGNLNIDRSNTLGIALSRLPNLERLSLRHNHLNVATTQSLIKGCCNLQMIRLRGNYYTNEDCIQLKKLIITNNNKKGLKLFKFLILPDDELGKLKMLDLSCDNFAHNNSATDLKSLGVTFLLCPKLTGINLDHNNLCQLSTSCLHALGDAISKCKNLKKLSLNGNHLEVSFIKYITERCSNLAELRLDLEYDDTIYINEEEHQHLQQLKQSIANRNRQRLEKPKFVVR